MIPRVAKLGTGFAGAGLYYLHDQRKKDGDARPSAEEYHLRDKGGAQTSHRVGFTETRNLPTRDPHKALKCMGWLAANATCVRQAAVAAAAKAAGMSYADYVRATNPFRGRKGSKPVYTLSIAWHPTKNRKPTRAEMLAAADEVLKVLGLADRQALIVEHKDTRHPHVHLIVNRVHPETGLYANVSNDRLKLSKWALDYEQRTKLVLCWDRVENWKKRDAARLDKAERRKTDPQAKGTYVLARGVPRRDHDWFRSVAHLPADEIRAARAARQEREREQATRKAADRTMKLEGLLTRRYGLRLAEVEGEIERLQRAEYWRKVRDRDPMSLILAPRHAFHALVDLVTARAFYRPRRIKALRTAAGELRLAMRDRRVVELSLQRDAFAKLAARHAAECRRDEERIAAMARAARGKGTADRGRWVFNVRGNAETARYVSPGKPLVTLSDIHARVARTKQAARFAAKRALSNAVRQLGGVVTGDALRRKTLAGMAEVPRTTAGADGAQDGLGQAVGPATIRPEPAPNVAPVQSSDHVAATPSNEAKAVPPAATEGQAHVSPPHTTPDDAERARFEARRDEKLARIEADNTERRRRKRVRPRGKSRRME